MPRQFGQRDVSTRWPACPNCPHTHEPGSACPRTGFWLVRGAPVKQPGVIWLKRPMPDGQWPPNLRLPRDDSFNWWVRAHCGHPPNGAAQFAFYEEKDADVYEYVFRDDPCRWSRCDGGRRSSGRW